MDEDNKLFSAFCPILDEEYSIYNLPDKYEHFKWKCPECGRKAYFNESLGYFQHKGVPRCGREAESIEHKVMKAYWYLMIPKFNQVKTKKIEYKIDGHEIDVYFELHDGKKVAVECQNSIMSIDKLRRRTKDYAKKNIYTLWIFNGYGFYKGINDLKLRELKSILRFIGKIQKNISD